MAGATTTASAPRPSSVWGMGERGSSHKEVRAGSEARAEKVVSPTIRRAPAVSTGTT